MTAIANIVKSSLGPVGLDKMLVDDIGVRFVKYYWIFFVELFRFREIRRVLNIEKDSVENKIEFSPLC